MNRPAIMIVACAILICGSVFGSAGAQAVSNQSIKFVVLSDIHLGLNEANNTYKMFHYSEKILEDMVAEINAMKDVRFVLVAGDMTKDSEPYNHRKALEILGDLKVPYYITPGNHDVSKKGLPAGAWGADDLRKNYHMPWQDHSLSFSLDPVPGVHLVSLDSASDEGHLEDWGGAVSAQDLSWLDEDLADNSDKTVIVLTHHALNYRPDVTYNLYYADNADQVKEILDKYGVHLAITGHIHITDTARNGTLIDMSNPAVCSYPCAYNVYQLSGSQITVHTVWYNNTTVREIAKDEFIKAGQDAALAEGTSMDRDATVNFMSTDTASPSSWQERVWDILGSLLPGSS